MCNIILLCVLPLQVRALLEHPDIDVNRRNNDRLTSFMLAMQSGNLPPHVVSTSSGPNALHVGGGARGGGGSSSHFARFSGRSDSTGHQAIGGNGNVEDSSSVNVVGASHRPQENAQEKLRRLMDLPATDDLEWSRQDRWDTNLKRMTAIPPRFLFIVT